MLTARRSPTRFGTVLDEDRKRCVSGSVEEMRDPLLPGDALGRAHRHRCGVPRDDYVGSQQIQQPTESPPRAAARRASTTWYGDRWLVRTPVSG